MRKSKAKLLKGAKFKQYPKNFKVADSIMMQRYYGVANPDSPALNLREGEYEIIASNALYREQQRTGKKALSMNAFVQRLVCEYSHD